MAPHLASVHRMKSESCVIFLFSIVFGGDPPTHQHPNIQKDPFDSLYVYLISIDSAKQINDYFFQVSFCKQCQPQIPQFNQTFFHQV